MNLPRKVTLWDDDKNYRKDITLDYLSDCSTECVIYLYVCNICKNNRSFYVGQTVNSCQKRASGHRASFNDKTFKKSALSYHAYKDHPGHVSEKLSIYSVGVLKACSATNLDRTEDYYVEKLKANLSLNRYKVT